jgi:hypothetical protein
MGFTLFEVLHAFPRFDDSLYGLAIPGLRASLAQT